MTHSGYLEARKQIDELNAAINAAPVTAKPVFIGLAKLHDAAGRYERKHGSEMGDGR